MIKLALPAGKANPAPPVGPALGAKVRRRTAAALSPLVLQLLHLLAAFIRCMRHGRHGRNYPMPAHAQLCFAQAYIPTPPDHRRLPWASPLPLPPLPPSPARQGVNIMQFCKEYNAATQDKVGMIIPVEISVYEDRSFTFVLKTPPASGERAGPEL